MTAHVDFFTVAVSSRVNRSASGTFATLCKREDGALDTRCSRGLEADMSYDTSIGWPVQIFCIVSMYSNQNAQRWRRE